MRMVFALLVAPVVAAVPFIALLPIVKPAALAAVYAGALVLEVMWFVVLALAGWLQLRACVAAGIVQSVLLLSLLPVLLALAGVGPWLPPAAPWNVPTIFAVVVVVAGAGAGAAFWWFADPKTWPSTDEMIEEARFDD